MSIGAKLIYGVLYLLSLFPMKILYLFSDGLFLLVYKLAHYRQKVVKRNLKESFPDKDEKELRDIEHKFYRWFCDYIVETIKFISISKSELAKRMRFERMDIINDSFANGKTCSLYLGHYCNWEWSVSLPLYTKGGFCAQIYHPIENQAFDQVMCKVRNRFGSKNIEMDKSFRTIVSWKRTGQINLVGYIADQVPGLHNVHCWVDFLHHDTPVFTGAERIAVLTDSVVLYANITRPKRGYYVCKFEKIELPPNGYVKFYYTREYYKMLERSINSAPEFWLWSHNRWKRTREDFNKLYTEEERARRLSRI